MLLIIRFFQIAILDIEDENGASIAAYDAVFAVGTEAEFADRRWDHQILMLQRVQCLVRANIDYFECVVAARGDQFGAVRAKFQASDLLTV